MAPSDKERHNLLNSSRRTCRSNRAKRRQLPLCSNTVDLHHKILPFLLLLFLYVVSRRYLQPSVAGCRILSPLVACCRPTISFAFHSPCCYIYTACRGKSMGNRYRHTLEKLAAEPPATKTALICSLLPDTGGEGTPPSGDGLLSFLPIGSQMPGSNP